MSTTKSQGLAVKSKNGKLESFTYELPSLAPMDVLISVSHCGLNPNDLHILSGDWAEACQFPVVLGNELAGTVAACGPRVQHLKVGQRVGVGMQTHSCSVCAQCLAGREAQCENHNESKLLTCAGVHGGLASHVQAHARHVFALPDSVSSEQAAPLMTSGATVYHALRKHCTAGEEVVGILGHGGLGQMAALFSRALGHKTVVLEVDEHKLAEAKKAGCEGVSTKDMADVGKKHADCLDVLLVFAENLSWKDYFPLLRRNGQVVFMCSSPAANTVSVDLWPHLLLRSLSVTGSFLSSRADTQRVLDFVSRNKVQLPQVDVRNMDGAQAALDEIAAGKAKQRIVVAVK